MSVPLDVRCDGPIATDTLLWRLLGTLHVTVVAKAVVSLEHEGVAVLREPARVRAAPEPLGRAIRAASERVPQRPRADVTLVGHAFPPGGAAAMSSKARLAIYRDRPILDRTIHVYGDRSSAAPAPKPFSRMPLVYERAYGGPGVAANPAGVGSAVSDPHAPLPNLVDPDDPRRPAAFAPVPAEWPDRRRLLGDSDPARLSAAVVEVASPRLLAYFQCAPERQQTPHLAGDEWIVLDGVHPSFPRVQSRLPGARPHVEARMDGVARVLPAALDTLAIDADSMTAVLVFRAYFPLLRGEAALSGLQVIVSLGAEAARPSAPARPAAKLEGTAALLPEDQARLANEKAAPFRPGPGAAPVAARPKERGDAPLTGTIGLSAEAQEELQRLRSTPFSAEAQEEPQRPRSAPPVETSVPSLASTRALTGDLVPRSPALPFASVPASAPEKSPVSAAVPSRPASRSLTGTAALSDAELQHIRRAAPLPFVPPDPPPEAAPKPVSKVIGRPPFRRSTPGIPIVTDAPLSIGTFAWQVRPPRDSITVVIKATFALVPDGPARLCEPAPLSGDVHVDDDTEKSLVYASDFAVFKPKADVTLKGHAYPSKPGQTTAHVALRFGSGKQRIERRAHVLGDRVWSGARIGQSPTAPAPFEKMPLVHERAFGGEGHDRNPAGTGYKASSGALPNLEHPDRPLRTPGDSPEPVCFAPIAPTWKARASKLGTYDKAWLRARWPYYPEDFDYHHFQHAPEAQQIEYPRGDEEVELRGMCADRPVLASRLPGVRARAFIEKTMAAKGGFSELPLHLDTVGIDADALKVHLVWRGLLEATDEEAPEVNVLFATLESMERPGATLDEARAAMSRALAPKAAPPGRDPEHAPVNDVAPPAGDAAVDPEIARAETEARDRLREIERALAAAGIPGGGSEPPPVPANPHFLAEALRRAGTSEEDIAGVLAALDPPPADRPPPAPAAEPAVRERALAMLASGQPMDGADLAEGELSGLDFSGRSLVGANLKLAAMRGCLLRGAHLEGASLAGCDLSGADLSGARLVGADLTGARLEDASLEGAHLEGADLSRSIAPRLRARGAIGARCSFAGADLAFATFASARLPALDLTGARLDDARFDEAELPAVRLYDAKGARARFDRALLASARADGAAFVKSSFRAASAPGSEWERASLSECTFHGARLAGAGLSRVDARGAVFSASDLAGARLRRANLQGGQLLKANLFEATLERADLTGADLRGANLYGAETWRARLEGAKLEGAIVARTKLKEKAT